MQPGSTQSYVYNSLDELVFRAETTPEGSFTEDYRYDHNGNQTSSGEFISIDYDQAGNRIREVDIGTPVSPRDWAEYEYDGDGNRLAKTTHRYFHGRRSSRRTNFAWDRTFAVPMLVSQQGNAVGPNTFVYGDRLLFSDGQTPGEGVRSYLTDHLGSVTERTDETGLVTDRMRYEPFGSLREDASFSPAGIGNSFGFAGEFADAETGFYHLRARTYDPGTGRFLQPDPLGGGYAYVGNNPLAYVDPSGTVRESWLDPYCSGLDALGCWGAGWEQMAPWLKWLGVGALALGGGCVALPGACLAILAGAGKGAASSSAVYLGVVGLTDIEFTWNGLLSAAASGGLVGGATEGTGAWFNAAPIPEGMIGGAPVGTATKASVGAAGISGSVATAVAADACGQPVSVSGILQGGMYSAAGAGLTSGEQGGWAAFFRQSGGMLVDAASQLGGAAC